MLAYSYEQWHARVAWNTVRRGAPYGVRPRGDRENTWRPVDERILLDGGVTLYNDLSLLAEDATLLRTMRYRVVVIDASRFRTTGAFHAKVRLMIGDRGRYDESLDGFAEALRRVTSPSQRVAFVLHEFDSFARVCGHLAHRVVDAMQRQSRASLLDGTRMVTLLHSRASTLRIAAVGARHIGWNEREAARRDAAERLRVPPSGIHQRQHAPVFEDVDDPTVVAPVIALQRSSARTR